MFEDRLCPAGEALAYGSLSMYLDHIEECEYCNSVLNNKQMEAKKIEPKGIMKIVRVVLGWIFGNKPKKEKEATNGKVR